jgi:chromosome segregation ATPase
VGVKINTVQQAFSKVKEDIRQVRSKLNEFYLNIEQLKSKSEDAATKSEFYDFIRELNDELKKLEKAVASQDAVERLRSNMMLQLNELRQDMKESRRLSDSLKKVEDLQNHIEEVKDDVSELNSLYEETDRLNNEIKDAKKNFVDWQQFFDKVKEISQDDNSVAVDDLKADFNKEIGVLNKSIESVKNDYASYKDFSENNDEINKKIKNLSNEKKLLEKRVSLQEKELKVLKKGLAKVSLMESHLGISKKKANKEKPASLVWPISVIVVIIVLLLVGMFFFGPSLMSPQTYANPEDLSCIEKFNCKLVDEKYLVNCSYDINLEKCHCSSDANATQCLSSDASPLTAFP